jgi:hypothetical protein
MKNTFLHFEETILDSPRVVTSSIPPAHGTARVRSLSDSSCGSGRGRGVFDEFADEFAESSEFVMVFEEDDFSLPSKLTHPHPHPAPALAVHPDTPPSTAATPAPTEAPEPPAETSEVSETTTVMLRNIPNKYTQKMLMEVFDGRGFEGRYDFFYLPMDFRHNCNLGFAFANFDSEATLREFTEKFEGFKLPGFNSTKVCQVSLARVQGLHANIQHYQNSPVAQVTIAEYKPVVLPLKFRP